MGMVRVNKETIPGCEMDTVAKTGDPVRRGGSLRFFRNERARAGIHVHVTECLPLSGVSLGFLGTCSPSRFSMFLVELCNVHFAVILYNRK